MLAYVQAVDASFGEPGSAGRGGPSARDSIKRMDPVAYVGDEEAKRYNKCTDAHGGTGRDRHHTTPHTYTLSWQKDRCGVAPVPLLVKTSICMV